MSNRKEYVIHYLYDGKGFMTGHEVTGEVVRCKDCKYWNGMTDGCIRNPCVEAWRADDFCNYGERRSK